MTLLRGALVVHANVLFDLLLGWFLLFLVLLLLLMLLSIEDGMAWLPRSTAVRPPFPVEPFQPCDSR